MVFLRYNIIVRLKYTLIIFVDNHTHLTLFIFVSFCGQPHSFNLVYLVQFRGQPHSFDLFKYIFSRRTTIILLISYLYIFMDNHTHLTLFIFIYFLGQQHSFYFYFFSRGWILKQVNTLTLFFLHFFVNRVAPQIGQYIDTFFSRGSIQT